MSTHILVVIFLLLRCFSLKVTSYDRPLLHPRPHYSFDTSKPVRLAQPSNGLSRYYDISRNPFLTPFQRSKPSIHSKYQPPLPDFYYKSKTPSLEELQRESFLKQINTGREQPKSNPFLMSCGVKGQNVQLMIRAPFTKKGEWPWLVALFLKISSSININKEFKCGASLISKNHVITAAHCVFKGETQISVNQILLKFGTFNIDEGIEQNTITKTPTRIDLPSNYDPNEYANDLAILRISDVNFNRHVYPVCLWNSYDHQEYYQRFKPGTVVGWGRDEDDNEHTSFPKSIEALMTSWSTCRESHPSLINIATPNTFCAGNKNESGPCNGDSGGGFYLQIGNKWFLRGIVSSAISDGGYCNPKEYVVYTDLAKYSSWINSKL